MQNKGVTMIEVIIYIGFIALLVPGMVFTLLEIQKVTSHGSDQILINQTATILESELRDEFLTAQTIDVSSSSFGIDYSTVVYVDDDGIEKTILLQNDTWDKSEAPRMIGRLQTVSLEDGIEWLTSNAMDVNKFYLQPVYSSGQLVGIVLELQIQPIEYDIEKESTSVVDLKTMFELAPYVQQI
ncbi:hypothetical protein KJ766_03285 [Patescibacteria group bacterium]|nr:hypothetical protein [Patescibacteria group bacterium]